MAANASIFNTVLARRDRTSIQAYTVQDVRIDWQLRCGVVPYDPRRSFACTALHAQMPSGTVNMPTAIDRSVTFRVVFPFFINMVFVCVFYFLFFV